MIIRFVIAGVAAGVAMAESQEVKDPGRPPGEPAAERLKFSETQTLDPNLRLEALGAGELGIDWSAVDWLPEPPGDREELAAVRDRIRGVTDELRRRIKEQHAMTWRYWGAATADKPATLLLLETMNRELIRAVMVQKLRFDRARPSFVDPEIRPVVAVPAHPAYPGGHAAQAYFFGALFAALDPDRSERYRELAREVGINREYAGLHYPSDTYAGALFGRYVLRRCLQHESFLRLWLAAAQEWETEQRPIGELTRQLVRVARFPGEKNPVGADPVAENPEAKPPEPGSTVTP